MVVRTKMEYKKITKQGDGSFIVKTFGDGKTKFDRIFKTPNGKVHFTLTYKGKPPYNSL